MRKTTTDHLRLLVHEWEERIHQLDLGLHHLQHLLRPARTLDDLELARFVNGVLPLIAEEAASIELRLRQGKDIVHQDVELRSGVDYLEDSYREILDRWERLADVLQELHT